MLLPEGYASCQMELWLCSSEVVIDNALSNRVIGYVAVFQMTAFLSGLASVLHSTQIVQRRLMLSVTKHW